jgi:formylglycine-generating enzyme required for sulfatase activity
MTSTSATVAPFDFVGVELGPRGTIVRRPVGSVRRLRVPIADGLDLALVLVPSGEFEMGSEPTEAGRWHAEGPPHRVHVAAFLLGQYPITQAQWRRVTDMPSIARRLERSPAPFRGDDLPVENIGWNDATEFCARLEALTSLPFRLPSEAEWEYACRAGTGTAFHYGETLSGSVANYACAHPYADELPQPARGLSTAVGTYPPNRFGLYDMHGNVFEWCADAWHLDYMHAPHDAAPWIADGYPNYRVLRGGAWGTRPHGCRSAYRTAAHQNRDHRRNTYGLRVALRAGG